MIGHCKKPVIQDKLSRQVALKAVGPTVTLQGLVQAKCGFYGKPRAYNERRGVKFKVLLVGFCSLDSEAGQKTL